MAKPVRVQYQTLVVIWFALLSSQLLFLLMIYLAKPELFDLSAAGPILSDQPLIIIVFAIAGLAFFLLAQVMSRQHLRRAERDQDETCVQTGLVLGCALSEVTTLLGVVLAFAFDYHYFFLWVALGALGVLLNFPRKSALHAATYKIQDQ